MKDFFWLFVMSHYHGRYKSEEISPTAVVLWNSCDLQIRKQGNFSRYWKSPVFWFWFFKICSLYWIALLDLWIPYAHDLKFNKSATLTLSNSWRGVFISFGTRFYVWDHTVLAVTKWQKDATSVIWGQLLRESLRCFITSCTNLDAK